MKMCKMWRTAIFRVLFWVVQQLLSKSSNCLIRRWRRREGLVAVKSPILETHRFEAIVFSKNKTSPPSGEASVCFFSRNVFLSFRAPALHTLFFPVCDAFLGLSKHENVLFLAHRVDGILLFFVSTQQNLFLYAIFGRHGWKSREAKFELISIAVSK